MVLALVALFTALRFRSRLPLICAAGWLVSLLITGFFYHNVYARYLLPDHVPLILFLAFASAEVWQITSRFRIAAFALLALSLARWGFVAWQIGTEPERAAVPATEIAQYFTGPWSGRGLNEVQRYLTACADEQNTQCLVLTHRFLRPGCYGLLLAELNDPRIGIVPLTIYEPQELAAALPGLRRATAGQRVRFFLLYEGTLYPAHPWLNAADSPVRRVLEVPRGTGESFTLFQVEVPVTEPQPPGRSRP